MQTQMAAGQHSFTDRLIGVATLKAPIYREIADDTTATSQAAIVVVVMALIGGVIGAAILGAVGASLPQGAATGSPVAFAIRTIINTIISWLIGAWVFAFVSRTFFGGKTNTLEMARVFGFSQIFALLNIVPCIGTIVALILSVVAAIIGIREASEFDTNKAVMTGVVGFIVLIVVSAIIGAILGVFGLV